MAGSDLLLLYSAITERGNRLTARQVVRSRLQYYALQLDANTTFVNRKLGVIKTPGVAQTALRLRDELRNGSDLLKATVVK